MRAGADKSEIVPSEPLACIDQIGRRHNVAISATVYRNWKEKPETQLGEGNVDIIVPWPLLATALTEADKSDPQNQLRVYTFQIGDRLAYKVMFTEDIGDKDIGKLALMAALMLGVEHHAEIRDAIAIERERPLET